MVRGALKGMHAWATDAVSMARDFAPRLSGRLIREIKVDEDGAFETEPMKFAIDFGVSGLAYARAHEMGSGLHATDPAERHLIEIEAGFWTGKSDKKALAFFWPNGPKTMSNYQSEGPHAGKHVFRKIYHPGVRAANEGQGYLRKAGHETKETGPRMVLSMILAEMRGGL